ncbi:MAG: DUF3365 domain-containing protein [Pseudomonadales bacterium]|jgi:hypothetical protein|nr:DUF3365 domain-containing protein [Pseudomonadales bacterium]
MNGTLSPLTSTKAITREKLKNQLQHAVFLLLSLPSLTAYAQDTAAQERTLLGETAQARSEILADRFQMELLSALNAAMAAQGPQGAIGVCASTAPMIAAQLSQESGASVRRTALRTRNPLAIADATEQEVMQSWATAPLDENGSPKRWSSWEGDEYRYMRAIPTMPLCLTCHGEQIDPGLSAIIRAYYPEDQATGFTAGQLRGAFSIRWDEATLLRVAAGEN